MERQRVDPSSSLSEQGGRFSRRQSIELLQALIARELRSRYRGSYLGWMWALARPLILLGIYGLVVGVFLGAARSIPEFMIFMFVGLIAWNLFATIVMGSITSVFASGPLIAKHRFPVVLVPVAFVVVALVDAAIMGLVLVLAYVLVGDYPSLSSLMFLPPSLIGIVLFGLAIGLVLAAMNVYARDVGFLTDVCLQVGFWLCPIVYSYGFVVRAAEEYGLSVMWVTRLYMLNPMANGVLGFQRSLWPPASDVSGAEFSFPGELAFRLSVLLIFSALFVAVAVWLFQRLSRNFAAEF
jgi:ABC-2 type transport system permease protein